MSASKRWLNAEIEGFEECGCFLGLRLADAVDLEGDQGKLHSRVGKLHERVLEIAAGSSSSPLDLLAQHKRAMYGQMFDLIYDCSSNRVAAKALVDRILEKIAVGRAEKPKKRRGAKHKSASAGRRQPPVRRKSRTR